MIPCAAVQYLTYSFFFFLANSAFVTRTNRVVLIVVVSLHPAHSFVSPSHSQWALGLGRVLLMTATARVLE